VVDTGRGGHFRFGVGNDGRGGGGGVRGAGRRKSIARP